MRAGNTQLAASSEPSAASAQLCGCHSVTWPLVTWPLVTCFLLGLPRHMVPGLLIPHSQDLWLLTGQELFFPRNKQRVGMTLAISGSSCSSLWFFFLITQLNSICLLFWGNGYWSWLIPSVSIPEKYLFVCVCEDLPSVCILGGYVIVVFDIQRCLWRIQPCSSQPFH